MEEHPKYPPNLLTTKLLEGLSFELRTLLNGFVGPVQLLKFNVDDPSLVEIFRMLDSTLSRLERLTLRTSIVQNAENLTQLGQKNDTINLVDLVKYCILDLQTISDLENITFNISNNNIPANISGSYDLLLQAFEVLFELAISLSESDSTIEVDLTLQNQRIVCNVTSPSATFPSDLNTDSGNSNKTSSATWDLLLAKQIIEGHKGQITTPTSQGNSFTIEFSGL
ncbi:MAG: hypothetical protein RBR30_03810 [Tenuifilaceae bacterium]|jgi:signal transduction histidine kinase|nr:hypothetical protein [Tenuifilaceae bacterium]